MGSCFPSGSAPPAGANRGHYVNPQVDRLIEEARVSNDLEKRRRNYVQIQEILHRDLPYIHLWYVDDVAVFHRRLSKLNLELGNYDFLRQVEVAGTPAEQRV